MDYAPLLWDCPNRSAKCVARAGTTVILLGPYDGSGCSNGIDDAATYQETPAQFDGLLWTNRGEVLAPFRDARKP